MRHNGLLCREGVGNQICSGLIAMYIIVADNSIQVKYGIEALDTKGKAVKVLRANKKSTFRKFKAMIRKYYTDKTARILYMNIKYKEAIL
jgi:hypothetical protein